MSSYTFRASDFPNKPGCYIMKSEDGRILYIGKSKALRKRLASYFRGKHDRKRIAQLVEQIAHIDVIVVNNEHESLLLENNLIKVHKPPFNRALKKDNSGYAYLKMTDGRFPRLDVHYRDRRTAKEEARQESPAGETRLSAEEPRMACPMEETRGARTVAQSRQAASIEEARKEIAASRERVRSDQNSNAIVSSSRPGHASAAPRPTAVPDPDEIRFGPFASTYFRDQLMTFVNDHFQLRTCDSLPKKACLLYHLKRCSGVCEGLIAEEDYRASAKEAAALLANQGERLIEAMKAKMELYASRLEFERAAHMLEHIRILERVPDKQVVDRESLVDQDVIYFGEGHAAVAKIRQGMLHDLDVCEWAGGEESGGIDRFVIERYRQRYRPDELIVSEIGDRKAVQYALRRRGQRPPQLYVAPKRGLRRELMELCRANYEQRMALRAAAGMESGGEG
ncbi:GIY-YIG nuclease family protein [Paenibacillus methanolicus]|uniref:GIY-YIG catalytic domain-containing protein n=1 Tax=Paenibacillus methanolicus TaxID=582686 RepID=A0A5S5BMM1_9BACL|nr:GIY-YIG nuclease family protein [Paenibacillus methanolicus]TYP68385.1 GIY-YIG catalytic domain-containing protein [Paenibacillus methanolicus]